MKKIFTLALLFVSYALFAGISDSRITITNLSNQQIQVDIDGKRYNNRVNGDENLVLVPSIPAGYHTIKIYTVTIVGNDTRPGMAPKKLTLLFQRNFSLKAQFHTDILINRFGKVMVDELSMNDRNYVDMEGPSRPGNGNGNNGGWNNGNGNGNGNGGGIGNGNNGNNGNGGWNNGNGNGGGIGNGNNGPRPMADQSFANFRDVLVKERVDASRVTIAKQVIAQNYFTTEQIKQIVQLFSFDNYKLDIAKYAYPNVLNRQDYFIIYEVFSFSSSKEDLANFIRNFK
jgi:hypothetical protein